MLPVIWIIWILSNSKRFSVAHRIAIKYDWLIARARVNNQSVFNYTIAHPADRQSCKFWNTFMPWTSSRCLKVLPIIYLTNDWYTQGALPGDVFFLAPVNSITCFHSLIRFFMLTCLFTCCQSQRVLPLMLTFLGLLRPKFPLFHKCRYAYPHGYIPPRQLSFYFPSHCWELHLLTS